MVALSLAIEELEARIAPSHLGPPGQGGTRQDASHGEFPQSSGGGSVLAGRGGGGWGPAHKGHPGEAESHRHPPRPSGG